MGAGMDELVEQQTMGWMTRIQFQAQEGSISLLHCVQHLYGMVTTIKVSSIFYFWFNWNILKDIYIKYMKFRYNEK
jgi:hypothetical protein